MGIEPDDRTSPSRGRKLMVAMDQTTSLPQGLILGLMELKVLFYDETFGRKMLGKYELVAYRVNLILLAAEYEMSEDKMGS